MTDREPEGGMPERSSLRRCSACNGRGYTRCDCWPGDCICGFGDETCEECDAHLGDPYARHD